MTAADYANVLTQLLPRGRLWPRPAGPNLAALLTALAGTLARVDKRIRALIDEADPTTTTELLREWETATGQPLPCFPLAQSFAQRRANVVTQLRAQGGATAAYFIAVAADIGYPGCTVDEVSAHLWRMNIPQSTTVTYFRAGQATAGDRLVEYQDQIIECVIDRLKPAHSRVVYNYGV